MANLSDLVNFALTVTIRCKKETRVESSFFTGPARSKDLFIFLGKIIP